MANLTQEQSVRRSLLIPLNIRELNDDRTPNKMMEAMTPQWNANTLDSTCTTPILNACSSTASQQSDLSITPIKSYPTAYLTPRSSLSFDTLGETTSADFYSIATDIDDLNATVTNQSVNSVYDTCVGASVRLLEATLSVRERLRPFRSGFLNKFLKLQRLSVVQTSQISIRGDQANGFDECKCEDGLFDGNCLKTFMEMSVQPAVVYACLFMHVLIRM